ncbi:MAG TPA: hypothetical protein VI457_12755 [Methylococcaceae bacterium]|nr:hypothetical protein [Methylococcaceae bacterium]
MTDVSQNKRICGKWKHCDGFSDTEFSFSLVDGQVHVSVLDPNDHEEPDIYDVIWDEAGLALSFAVHWETGRFVKYRVAVGPRDDRLQATITYTVQELWERL